MKDVHRKEEGCILLFLFLHSMGMQGFDSVILVLFAAIRDRIGSRYPLDATINCRIF